MKGGMREKTNERLGKERDRGREKKLMRKAWKREIAGEREVGKRETKGEKTNERLVKEERDREGR